MIPSQDIMGNNFQSPRFTPNLIPSKSKILGRKNPRDFLRILIN